MDLRRFKRAKTIVITFKKKPLLSSPPGVDVHAAFGEIRGGRYPTNAPHSARPLPVSPPRPCSYPAVRPCQRSSFLASGCVVGGSLPPMSPVARSRADDMAIEERRTYSIDCINFHWFAVRAWQHKVGRCTPAMRCCSNLRTHPLEQRGRTWDAFLGLNGFVRTCCVRAAGTGRRGGRPDRISAPDRLHGANQTLVSNDRKAGTACVLNDGPWTYIYYIIKRQHQEAIEASCSLSG
jgi:hypothetical protein